MADEPRVYTDEEFALILRKAAEMANATDAPAGSSGGLTLSEMKAAAAQAGLDPALVERAARTLAHSARASILERLTGGPLHHRQDARFPIALDEPGATRLLSVVRIGAGLAGMRDVGHASGVGMSWHDGGELESLRVAARPDGDGTTVSVTLDRRGTLGVVVMTSGIATFLTLMFGVFALYPEAPALGVAGSIVGVGGILAGVRAYWASSTRRVRERIDGVMDAIGKTLDEREEQLPSSRPPALPQERLADDAAPAVSAATADVLPRTDVYPRSPRDGVP